MPRIPVAAVDKIIRENTELRVGQSAKEQMREILEKQASKIGSKAAKMAEHSKRNTVLDTDVQFILDLDKE